MAAAPAPLAPLSDVELTAALRQRLACHPVAKTKCSITVTITTAASTAAGAGETVLEVGGSVPVRPYGSEVNLLLDEFVTEQRATRGHAIRVHRTLTFTEPPGKLQTGGAAAVAGGALGVPDSELVLYADPPELLARKIAWLARATRAATHAVCYTGAGLSTAARIPDFRGPDGVWTRRDRGQAAPTSIALEAAQPTYAHRVLTALVTGQLPPRPAAAVAADGKSAASTVSAPATATATASATAAPAPAAGADGTFAPLLGYVVSQNIDGLHRRSGLPAAKLAELHGNAYRETCSACHAEHMRDFDVCVRKGAHYVAGATDPLSESGINHFTGRKCEKCSDANGMLRDSIIHFGESLPLEALTNAAEHASRSDFAVCIGTSLHVRPACDLPERCAKPTAAAAAAKDGVAKGARARAAAGGPLCIVNLQSTGKDRVCLATGCILVHAKADAVAELWSHALGLDIPMTDDERAAMNAPAASAPAPASQATQQQHVAASATASPTATASDPSNGAAAGAATNLHPHFQSSPATAAAAVPVAQTALGSGAGVNLRAAAVAPFAALAAKFSQPTHHTSLLIQNHPPAVTTSVTPDVLPKGATAVVGSVMDIKPQAPSQVVHLRRCGPGTTYRVRGRCAKLIVEQCAHVTVVVDGPLLTGSLELIRCSHVRVVLRTPAHTFTLDSVEDVQLLLSRADVVHRVVLTGDSTDVRVAVNEEAATALAATAADAKSAPAAATTTATASAAAAAPNAAATAPTEPAVAYHTVPDVRKRYPQHATAFDQYFVVFDAFGVPALEPLVRQGCVMGTAAEHAAAAEKLERQNAAMQRAVEEMMRFAPAPPARQTSSSKKDGDPAGSGPGAKKE